MCWDTHIWAFAGGHQLVSISPSRLRAAHVTATTESHVDSDEEIVQKITADADIAQSSSSSSSEANNARISAQETDDRINAFLNGDNIDNSDS